MYVCMYQWMYKLATPVVWIVSSPDWQSGDETIEMNACPAASEMATAFCFLPLSEFISFDEEGLHEFIATD